MSEKSDFLERYQQRTRKTDPRLCITGSYKAFERVNEQDGELGTEETNEEKGKRIISTW